VTGNTGRRRNSPGKHGFFQDLKARHRFRRRNKADENRSASGFPHPPSISRRMYVVLTATPIAEKQACSTR